MKHPAPLLLGIMLLAGCGEPSATESRVAHLRSPDPLAATRALGADVDQDLATLRRVTAPFHHFANAVAAGWSAQITPCMTDPNGAGGMGFHYGNPDYIDGSVRVDQPELLLYEPEQNGQLRLVAVEYIVPLSQWKAPSPPRLFGRDFRVNDQFQVWALHAWVWKENPSGIFADWNPLVSCANTTAAATMDH